MALDSGFARLWSDMNPKQAQSQLSNWKVPFFTIWTGQAFSLFGSMLVQFALVWWLTAQTGSATVLAIGTLVALLPTVLIGPLAGAFVDRHSRRVIMIAADSFVALVTLWLVILYALGGMQVGHVYAAMFLRAAAGAFQWPAMQASTSLMVPKQHLARVGGMNQALNGLLGIVAPPTGALLVMVLPLNWVLAVDIVTAALAVLPLCVINVPQPAPAAEKPGEPRKNLLEDMRVGFRYLLAWKGGMLMIAVAIVVKFFLNPAFSLLPILAVKHFHGGALEMGWLDAASGVGMVAGGVLLSVWGGFRRKIVTVLCGLAGLGAGMLLVGLTPSGLLGMGSRPGDAGTGDHCVHEFDHAGGSLWHDFRRDVCRPVRSAAALSHRRPGLPPRNWSVLFLACDPFAGAKHSRYDRHSAGRGSGRSRSGNRIRAIHEKASRR
jgi:DHA3 family macrolide efflux protein-like MFS transporter